MIKRLEWILAKYSEMVYLAYLCLFVVVMFFASQTLFPAGGLILALFLGMIFTIWAMPVVLTMAKKKKLGTMKETYIFDSKGNVFKFLFLVVLFSVLLTSIPSDSISFLFRGLLVVLITFRFGCDMCNRLQIYDVGFIWNSSTVYFETIDRIERNEQNEQNYLVVWHNTNKTPLTLTNPTENEIKAIKKGLKSK